MASNKFRNIQYYYQQKYRIEFFICNQVLSKKKLLFFNVNVEELFLLRKKVLQFYVFLPSKF